MQIYFGMTVKNIVQENEEKCGATHFLRGLLALETEPSISAVSSAFNNFSKMAYFGLSSSIKTTLLQFRPAILNLMSKHAESFMPEIYTDETKLRIVSSEGKTLMEQSKIMSAKPDFLYKYQMLLAVLYNIDQSEELREQILRFSKSALRLGETELSKKILSHFEIQC